MKFKTFVEIPTTIRVQADVTCENDKYKAYNIKFDLDGIEITEGLSESEKREAMDIFWANLSDYEAD